MKESNDSCQAAAAYPVLSLRKVDMRSRIVPSASTTSRPVTLPCMEPYLKYLSPPESMMQAVSQVGTLSVCCFKAWYCITAADIVRGGAQKHWCGFGCMTNQRKVYGVYLQRIRHMSKQACIYAVNLQTLHRGLLDDRHFCQFGIEFCFCQVETGSGPHVACKAKVFLLLLSASIHKSCDSLDGFIHGAVWCSVSTTI